MKVITYNIVKSQHSNIYDPISELTLHHDVVLNAPQQSNQQLMYELAFTVTGNVNIYNLY